MSKNDLSEAAKVHLGVSGGNLQPAGRTKRLREAVRAAGGNQVIAERSGIPISTLGRAIASGDLKTSVLTVLAEACGVTVEWLATGRGPMRPGQAPPPEPAQPAAQSTPTRLFATVDMDLLAECMAAAMDQLQRHSPRPSWGRAVQMATLLYDQIKEDRAGSTEDAESPNVTYKR